MFRAIQNEYWILQFRTGSYTCFGSEKANSSIPLLSSSIYWPVYTNLLTQYIPDNKGFLKIGSVSKMGFIAALKSWRKWPDSLRNASVVAYFRVAKCLPSPYSSPLSVPSFVIHTSRPEHAAGRTGPTFTSWFPRCATTTAVKTHTKKKTSRPAFTWNWCTWRGTSFFIILKARPVPWHYL